MTVEELIEELKKYPKDILVSLNEPKCVLEDMNTCFVDSDSAEFFVHDNVLILNGVYRR